MWQSLFLGLGISLFLSLHDRILVRSKSATFTGTTLTTSLGEMSLVDDDANFINSDGNIECNNDDYDTLCVSLTINNHGNCMNGVETLEVTVYGGRISGSSGNEDLFAVFSVENSESTDGTEIEFVSFFSDWDDAVAVESGGSIGGVFAAPNCESSSLLTTDDNDWPNTILDGVTDGWGNRAPIGGGDDDNWELLTSESVGDGTSPIRYAIVNDYAANQLRSYFNVPDSTDFTGVSCNYNQVFDSSNNNYVIAFGTDHGTIELTQIDVKVTCDTCDSEYSHSCTAWGDPHITTWDGTYYHFQGEGYFDYVKSCDESQISLPFLITGKQEWFNTAQSATRLYEILVTIYDDDNNDDNDIVISYPSSGSPTFKDSGNSAIGTYTIDIDDGTTMTTGTYKVWNTGFEIEFNINNETQGQLYFIYSGWTLTMKTTDCLSDILCGLCGDLDNDDSDDFTRCDNLEIVDNTNAASSYSDADAWSNTHVFGESCCNYNYDILYFDDGELDCGDENITLPDTPDSECMETSQVEDVCYDAWDNYCLHCDTTDATDEWISSCIYDLCVGCEDNSNINNEWSSLTFDTAVNEGCLDSSINECEVSCVLPTLEPTIMPSNTPSESPTSKPSTMPTSSPTCGIYETIDDWGKSWVEAQEYCQDTYGTNLASIESYDELLEAVEALDNAGAYNSDSGKKIRFWIGLNDYYDNDGEYTWIDGSDSDYRYGFVNNGDGLCTQVVWFPNSGSYWNTANCESTKGYFVCHDPACA